MARRYSLWPQLIAEASDRCPFAGSVFQRLSSTSWVMTALAERADPAALRLVLDTQVWLDLLLFDDPRCAGLRRALASRRVELLTDAACGAEWRRVLGYPALGLRPEQVDDLNRRFDAFAVTRCEPRPATPLPPLPRCRDRDDQKFLELALAANARVLLSRDNALLELAGRVHRRGLFRICRPEDMEFD